jgi:hypothetical protein
MAIEGKMAHGSERELSCHAGSKKNGAAFKAEADRNAAEPKISAAVAETVACGPAFRKGSHLET